MPLGTFTLTATYQGYDGVPASGTVTIDGIPEVILDPVGNKVNVGPKVLQLNTLGGFSIALATDSTSGLSTSLGYRVTVKLKGEASSPTPTEFYAPAAGDTLDLSDVMLPAGASVAVPDLSLVSAVLSAESAAATFVTAVTAGGPGNADITLYLNGTKLFTVRPGSPPTFV